MHFAIFFWYPTPDPLVWIGEEKSKGIESTKHLYTMMVTYLVKYLKLKQEVLVTCSSGEISLVQSPFCGLRLLFDSTVM